MFNRFCFGALLFAGIAVSITGCNNASSGLDAILVSPSTASLTVGGSTLQMTVTGMFGNGSHPTTASVTSGVTWTSAIKGVATVDSSGVVTPVGPGSTSITASARGFAGTVSSSATITVTPGGTTVGGGDIVSLSIIPSAQTVEAPGDTGQFIAIGMNASGANVTVTGLVSWGSSSTQIATITPTGLATAASKGSTTITAIYTNRDQTTAAATATFTVTGGGTTQSGGDIVSLSIIPGAQTVAVPLDTAQFIAIGTNSSGATSDLTSQVIWGSSSSQIATISASGLATAQGQGSTTITALYTNTDQTTATSSATFAVTSGGTQAITAVTVIPATQSLSASGQTGQFIALGTSGSTGLIEDVSDSPNIQWISTAPSIATVSSSGLAAGVSQGTTSITAIYTNSVNNIVSSSPVTVSVTLTAAPEPLLAINIVPADITVGTAGQSVQFLAFGTYSTVPYVRDLTNLVTWYTSSPELASIESGGTPGEDGGLATAMGYTGDAFIYAMITSSDGTVVLSDQAKFTCSFPTSQICEPGPAPVLLATLTVYDAGENRTTWQVTAPSDTLTPDLIHCGPGWTAGGGAGGSVCTGTYVVGTTVTLTASPSDSTFGGWTANCGAYVNKIFVADTGPTCTMTLNTNESVGAIFY
jgi:hypothetical protein